MPLISVNYFITRTCNYRCGFCFHTAKNAFHLPLHKAKYGLQLLGQAGMQKINFAGGEPFILDKGEYLGELLKFCKDDLQIQSTGVISNGSKISEQWMQRYSEYLDILGISCDSFNDDTNKLIGRYSPHNPQHNHVTKLKQVREWCSQYQVAFKLNTVVNTYNYQEDMTAHITALDPVRWKVFQCLLLEGENFGPKAKRDATKFLISPT